MSCVKFRTTAKFRYLAASHAAISGLLTPPSVAPPLRRIGLPAVTLMTSIRRILCPVDFSEFSRHALTHAVGIAKCYHARVSALHVHRLTTPAFAAAPVAMPMAFEPIVLTEAERKQLEAALDAFVAPGRATAVSIETVVVEDPDVAGAIVSQTEALGVDLIAMGTRGRSGFQRFMLGSVTEKVLRKASCPVLTVPPHVSSERPVLERPFILCPVDFSKASARALQYAASLARDTDGQLTILHVIELPADDLEHPDLESYRAVRFEDATLSLAGTIAGLSETCKVRPLVLAGQPYKEILRVASEQQADLLVMGVQGRGAIDLALFGSTTHHVVRQGECPVLTLNAAG
jgi:nucleotide-binding universal stress UspA family protein